MDFALRIHDDKRDAVPPRVYGDRIFAIATTIARRAWIKMWSRYSYLGLLITSADTIVARVRANVALAMEHNLEINLT